MKNSNFNDNLGKDSQVIKKYGKKYK